MTDMKGLERREPEQLANGGMNAPDVMMKRWVDDPIVKEHPANADATREEVGCDDLAARRQVDGERARRMTAATVNARVNPVASEIEGVVDAHVHSERLELLMGQRRAETEATR